ncbi:Uncharacterised protein [Mycobacterium tuberculosis]|nr:Uncharacterised protein [Mycobacterium tuberculosis]
MYQALSSSITESAYRSHTSSSSSRASASGQDSIPATNASNTTRSMCAVAACST